MTIHRSFSVLAYSMEEFTTESFMVLAPIVVPNVSRRAAHTAGALKAVELFSRLLAIPCAAERHSLFSMSIAAQIATMQISACKNLLEDYALVIGRDRLRLTIGFLNTMGDFWPLGKKMAQEVKAIARSALVGGQDTVQANTDGEVDVMDTHRRLHCLITSRTRMKCLRRCLVTALCRTHMIYNQIKMIYKGRLRWR
jgi:hypothetical protein